jgi:hypothetical protein
MNLTLKLLEEYVGRLQVTEDTYYIFEELLKQPYDIYRPIMDMLFDGTIVIEDLIMPTGQTAAYSNSTTNGASTNTSSWDISSTSVANRCIALINGTKTSAVITSVDNSVLTTSNTTSLIGSSYVTSETSIAGSDSTTAVPNPIEVARSSSYTDAQKAVQDALLAATSSTIS